MRRSKWYSCRVQGWRRRRRKKLEGGEVVCTYFLACGTLLDRPFVNTPSVVVTSPSRHEHGG
jgi:hypothetical protein